MLRIGADKAAAMARTLGIASDIEAVPAIALGGLDRGVSPLEMAGAYATLAAGGRRAPPYSIESVTSADGKTLFSASPDTEQAVPAPLAWLVTNILRGVITRGTGTAAEIGRPAAGKTGTTQEHADAWFVGYVPQLTAAVWVGYPDAMRPMSDVHGDTVSGGSLPARIWRRFMTAALAGTEVREFERPEGVVRLDYCTASGGKATQACPDVGIRLVPRRADAGDVHPAQDLAGGSARPLGHASGGSRARTRAGGSCRALPDERRDFRGRPGNGRPPGPGPGDARHQGHGRGRHPGRFPRRGVLGETDDPLFLVRARQAREAT